MSSFAKGLIVTAWSLLAPALSASGVIVVDPGGGPGATLLQAALDASQPGDILLLKAGDYSAPGAPAITAAGGRVIVADTGVMPTLAGLRLSGASTSPTVVRDLVVAPVPGTTQAGFELLSTGRTWIEGCHAQGTPVEDTILSPAALNIQTSPAVYVIRGDFAGGDGVDAHAGPGGTLIKASGGGAGISTFSIDLLVVHDTRATGGAGADGMPDLPFKASGGQGLNAGFGQLASLLGGTFRGGDEGSDDATVSDAGPGVEVVFQKVQLRDVTLIAGQTFGAGTPGLPLELGFAEATEFPAPTRTLELSSPVRELEPVTVTIHGQQGDLATVVIATDFGGASAPLKQGVYAFGATSPLAIGLGPITAASGDLVTAVRLGRLPPGVDGMQLYAQLLVASAQGQTLVGTASSVTWLSATL